MKRPLVYLDVSLAILLALTSGHFHPAPRHWCGVYLCQPAVPSKISEIHTFLANLVKDNAFKPTKINPGQYLLQEKILTRYP